MASGGARRRKGRRGGRGKVKRKTKYLSLSRFLIKKEEEEEVVVAVRSPELVPKEEAPSSPEDGGDGGEEEEKPQMEPFALHPEPSTLFAAAPSLTDILGASAGGGGGGESSSAASPGVSGGKELPGEEDDHLARRALRGRERWVYCSSSSPSATTTTTTTTTTTSSSCSSAASTGASSGGDGAAAAARSLLLKLDYEEILAAWAGRGSLYIGGGGAATAGGTDHAAAELELDSVFVEVSASPEPAAAAAAAWSVAEPAARAEKVRRYKEKRQGRLFAKRIRYEVRRLNAVKRPRLKDENNSNSVQFSHDVPNCSSTISSTFCNVFSMQLEQMLPVAVEPLHAPFCRRCKSSVSSRE
uniref:CCT domain-containing protein n=1 Tax=Oryza meridionalis TaxID=40149 RepID=A0A0E0EH86_9ORYZ